jgi:uncharacterized membrane protein
MGGSKLPYAIFFAALFLFNFFIFLTPFLAATGNQGAADSLYFAFAPTCHQLTSRSWCIYKSAADGSYSISDCFPTSAFSPSKVTEIIYPGSIAYKLPVCSRDTAIYLAMLIGLIILPFITRIDSEEWPNRWILVAAAIPIAIDGTTQLVGLRESTNFLRLVTGAIIGVVLPFYILPILNSLYIFIQAKLRKKKPGKRGDR